MMALNVELRINDDSECQTEDVTLNVKRKRDMMTPNVELMTNDGCKHQTEDVALNAQMKMRL